MSTLPEFGTLEFVLGNGRRLLPEDPAAAEEQAREILKNDPDCRPAMRLLAAALRSQSKNEEARDTEDAAIKAAGSEPTLVETAQALAKGDFKRAEHLVRPYLEQNPDDPAGFRLLAEVADNAGFPEKAADFLRTALELAPAYSSARLKLAQILHKLSDFRGAIDELDALLVNHPKHWNAAFSKAATLVMVGDFAEAAGLYEELTKVVGDKPDLWISYANVLNTLGRFEDALASYHQAIKLRPAHGEAWWSISNMKVSKFDDRDIKDMQAALDSSDLDDTSRLQLHFALGKAFEDRAQYEISFKHYEEGNAIRSEKDEYDLSVLHTLVERCCDVFSPEYFEQRTGWGSPDHDPIFIVGMPRSGSTLIEQILASHSKIEGTAELPYIPTVRQQLGFLHNAPYPDSFLSISQEEALAAGKQFMTMAEANRKTDRPYFIDKMPNNWESIGMILTILPNAKIIDARRHPMACCFSNFKQHFARGQEFSYSLQSLGAFYTDYVRMLAHFDAIFPGRIKRVFNEQLIENPEREIRELLEFIGIDYEQSCLRFYETERPVRTPSSGQVRQPLNRKGIDSWRSYEPWLGALKDALGMILECYPEVPTSFYQYR